MRSFTRPLSIGIWAAVLLAVGAVFATPVSAAERPDIEEVTVSRDLQGTLRFAIAFAAPVVFTADTRLQVMIDADRDSSTGIQGGEYALEYSALWDGADPTATLLTATDGETESSTPASLAGSVDGSSITFQISASDIGSPGRFDFWVFVDENRKVVDTAPTHVVFSSASAPWTYPKGGEPQPGGRYPVETYSDTSDVSLTQPGSMPWLPIVLGIAALGALVGVGGYTYDRIRKRTPPPTPLSPST